MQRFWIGLRRCLEETHSTRFELQRHFFRQFFETEFVSAPGQAKIAAAGALAILLSLGVPYSQAYYHKYLMLDGLPDAGPYRQAVLADMLFGITFAGLAGGIFTTLQWPSLFPGLRDYLALAALPTRVRDIFLAKFASLLAVASLLNVAITLPPALLTVFLMAGRYAGHIARQPFALIPAASLASMFVFFSLVALQGVMLNLLPPRTFARVSMAIQATLLIILLGALPLVLMTPDLAPWMALRPEWALRLPPLWFLGLEQLLMGNTEPLARALAWRAMAAVMVAALAAVLTYLWSYRKHRVRVLESPGGEKTPAHGWQESLAERLLRNVRSLAAFSFTGKTLARSRQHRLLLTGFAGVAVALIGQGFVALFLNRRFSLHAAEFRQAVTAVPLALSLCTLVGLRYLFRLPVELRANWLFRVCAPGHAPEILIGVEQFLFIFGALPVAAITLPAELRMLGIKAGLATGLLCLLVSLILMQLLLYSFEKIPFTSAYMPGQQLLVQPALRYIAITAIYVGITGTLVSWAVLTPVRTAILSLVLIAACWRARSGRLGSLRIERLEFAETLEPAVRRLAIDGD